MRYYVVTGVVAGAAFASGKRLAGIEAGLTAAGADDISLEIVSGVLVRIGFSIDADTVDKAGTRADEVIW